MISRARCFRGVAMAMALMAPLAGTAAGGGEPPPPPASYGNTPDELLPYRDFGAPYRLLFAKPLAFLGPGREEPAPPGLDEVRIGLLAPGAASPDGVEGRGMRRGAELAVEEANAGGGYRGLPFRLIEHDDLPVWGASSNEIVAMVYRDKVWAILGSVSGDSSHIAIRVALKSQVAVMNSASADPTLTETAIPWAFRCIADARQQGYALAQAIFEERGLERLAILRSNDRYGRMGIVELREAALRLGHPPVVEVQWIPTQPDFPPLVERIRAARPDAVVLWGKPEQAAEALKALRNRGVTAPVFGPARLTDPRFRASAGEAAEGVVLAATFDPTSEDPVWRGFRARYNERFGEDPGAFAAHAYDGMSLLVAAVRTAGLNRVRIRDALAEVTAYHGVTGEILFDNTFNDVGRIYLARVEDGALVYRPAPLIPRDPRRPPATIGLVRGSEGALAAAGRSVERGVRLALGERDAPPRLVVAEARGPWSGVGEAARDLVEKDGAAGLISALDGKGSHVAAQVATKLRRPLAVAIGATPLLRHTGVGWVLTPDGDGPVWSSGEVPAGFAARYRALYGSAPDEDAVAGYLAAGRLCDELAVLAGRKPVGSARPVAGAKGGAP